MKFTKVLAAAALIVLAGCSTTSKAPEKISLLAPQGAPALATLSIYGSEYADVTTVSGSDVLTSELAKEDAAYDVIIAPINLGTKMMEKGNTKYKLNSVITWGNLYVVGTKDYTANDELAAFGENAVPGMILSRSGLQAVPTFYNSVQDVQAQLISGKVQAGLIAEPAATATIAKAKQQGIELSVLTDMQEIYQKTNNTPSKGYPQAAIFVKEGSEDKAKDAIAQIETFANDTAVNSPDEITPLIEKAGVDNLGVPNAEIVVKSWGRQNIKFVKASEAEEEVKSFLALYDITFTSDMLSK